jgi:HSP20 family protein
MTRAITRKRWGADLSPWQELDFISDRMRGMMDPSDFLFRTPVWFDAEKWAPAVELVEKDNEYLLTAELPGIPKGDVDVAVEDNVLTLKGEKKTEFEEEKDKMHFKERRYGSFERSFTLPRNVDATKIKAEFHDGIVKVHLPKGEETKPRHIDIK